MVKAKSVEKSMKSSVKTAVLNVAKKKPKPLKTTLRKKRNIEEKKGVVYLSHIPHGFYEEEIKAYFKQFGKVTAVSLPRSKTGKAKGYAFIEFLHPEVAEIAAEAMNNYLMFNRLIKAKYLPPDEQKPQFIWRAQKAREAHTTVPEKAAKKVEENRTFKNRELTVDLEAKQAAQLLKRNEAMKRKLKQLGVEYEFKVKEDDLDTIFEKRKEMLKNKKKPLQDERLEKNNLSSEDEEDLSSIEGDVDLSDEDQVMDFLSEEETEEHTLKCSTKAVKGAKSVDKTKKSKAGQSKLNEEIKLVTQTPSRPTKRKSFDTPIQEVPILSSKKRVKPSNTTVSTKQKQIDQSSLSEGKDTQSNFSHAHTPEENKTLKHKSSKEKSGKRKSKAVLTKPTIDKDLQGVFQVAQSMKHFVPKGEKSKKSKKSLSSEPIRDEDLQSSLSNETKSLKPKSQNSTGKKSLKKSSKPKTPVLEVEYDAEIDLKTPPNMTKKILKSRTDPAKMTLKENSKSGLDSVHKKKPRHRKLNSSQ